MIAGLRGSLLSHDALTRTVPDGLKGRLGEDHRESARRELRSWIGRAFAELGPASTARAVFDRLAAPLATLLGYQVVLTTTGRPGAKDALSAWLSVGGAPAAAMVVTPWEVDGRGAWRETVRQGIGGGVRWCVAVTGPSLRLFDARRTYSRREADIDLAIAAGDPSTFAVLWGLVRAEAIAVNAPGDRSTLDLAVQLCERYRTDVRSSLQHGVHDALTHLVGAFVAAKSGRSRARPAISSTVLFDESLVVIYRILFLLFAEARGLVPRWHPVYRDSYTIEALRAPAETRPRPRGLWEALQAIARLAHRGCRAGTLRVPPFNGRLFSPAQAPLADSVPLDDGAVREALVALTTRRSKAGVEPVAYADLGVEQLGGVYERVLDFEPAVSGTPGPAAVTLVRGERRKATGSFYTPRSLTEYLVRRTLAPLVHDATPEHVLGLRVLDPAMGSGAFLVAACRYLAAAYERALVREGGLAQGDITDSERANFRRAIAQRCLFGVDVNPMAVQLGRLSLWLATLAADKPLTFLDHHLRTGNSLLGASLADVVRHPFASRRTRAGPLPLFDDRALDSAMQATVEPRLAIANEPGDTLDQVRAKERMLGRLDREDGPLATWKRIADVWCGRWFPPDGDGEAAARMKSAQRSGVFGAIADQLLGRGPTLPAHVAGPLLADLRAAAARERFFHWTLEFPEVFHTEAGGVVAVSGFDAVLGNPPWEMLRGDRGAGAARKRAGEAAGRLTDFARSSGVYPLQSGGHANLYQLFLERALSLVRRGGRVGMVLPSGFATDHGCAELRRHVLDRTSVDVLISIENREGLFPIHRGLKFLLLCTTAARETTAVRLRSSIRAAETLDRLPDMAADTDAIVISRTLIERFTGHQLAIPEFRSAADVDIVAKISSSVPPLGAADGWHLHFGRELNASDDREHFTEGGKGLPVVEGKHVQPFVVDVTAVRHRIARGVAARLLPADETFGRPRLAYRDVAAATNRLTLIAAIVPVNVVTTHTLFCLKEPVDEELQQYLCGIFNSYVANYLVRLRVSTHVTTSIIERLPVPMPARNSRTFKEIGRLAAALARDPDDGHSAARLQGAVARLYGLSEAEFRHVLTTFPLISSTIRDNALRSFSVGRA
jgi:hypothetical protein